MQEQSNALTSQPSSSHEESVALAPGLVPIVITAFGKDRPGVSATFFRVLSAHGVQVLDVEQSVFRSMLSLGALVGVAEDKVDTLREGLVESLKGHGMSVKFDSASTSQRSSASTHAIVVLGNPVNAEDISRIGQTLADYGANIDTIRGIADYPVTGLELLVSIPNPKPGAGIPLRAALAELAQAQDIDIAIERDGLQRRSKRLICFDVDSTLITGEVIEMLAAHAGREAEVAAVTERAMRGELDFAESLHERVKALAGLPVSVLEEVSNSIELTPGARTTIRTLKRLGYKCGAVSGGFIQILEPLAKELGLDFYKANTLEIEDGKLTGRVVGGVVDRQEKARSLKAFAEQSGLHMHQTVAVGDGANDIDMLSVAGLGIAFNAKPALKEIADTSVNVPFMDSILFMLGISRDEIDIADREDGTYRRVPLEQ
ncbi:phosphoserine phosphatase SerB [Corynebacterium lactis]|uniref:phosphoserine phosphatase n=1 Tax=Corynebacterium lactis RW2-5 TaxID=1408189 RepID=A0A0K2GYY3_9CORY|nr:phosphoserine phosphatase SerB [Corynebacterium lactis]ALA66888.1 phosphoserine phosphatase [Corynebacterium lactis RW2-5]